jgi:hypothetical protein
VLRKIDDFDAFMKRHPLLKNFEIDKRLAVYRTAKVEMDKIVNSERVLNEGGTVVNGGLYPDWEPQSNVLLSYTRQPLSRIPFENVDNFMSGKPFVEDLPSAAKKYLYDFAAVKLSVLKNGYALDMMKPDSHQLGYSRTGRMRTSYVIRLVDLTPVFTHGSINITARAQAKDILTYTSRGRLTVEVDFPVPSPVTSKGRIEKTITLASQANAYHDVFRRRAAISKSFLVAAYETDPLAPATPQNIRYAVHSDTVLGRPIYLTWDATTNCKGYAVYKKIGGGAYAFLTMVTKTSYTDYVPGGATYYYKVTATNAYGESGDSAEVTVIIS